MSALDIPERQILLQFPDDPNFTVHHRVLFVRVRDALWVVGRNARQIDEVLGAEGMDEDEVPKVWVAIQSKDWISAGTEVGLPLIDWLGTLAGWLRASHHPAHDTGGEGRDRGHQSVGRSARR